MIPINFTKASPQLRKALDLYYEMKWDKAFPEKQVFYNAKSTGAVPIIDLIRFSDEDKECARKVVERIKQDYFVNNGDCDKFMVSLMKFFVQYQKFYTSDKTQFGKNEYWQSPTEFFKNKFCGDCVSGFEEIVTFDGIKKVRDLKDGDVVLSYDFEKQEYVYKQIKNFQYKGDLKVNKVLFKNAHNIYVTDNHPLWVRTNQKEKSIYEKQYLSDIDLSRWWKKKIPVAKKLEVNVKDIDSLSEKHLFIIGHYLAEGWAEGGHVCTSGYEIDENISPLLDELDIPYSEYENNSGVPCLRFLKSNFKELLKTLKKNSFDIHIPQELLFLPENKIKALLDGYWLGDGHVHHKQSGYDVTVYSTSSKQWAEDMSFMLNRLGTPCYFYKQLKHGGVGKEPIYRLEVNLNGRCSQDHGYAGLSETTIKNITEFDTVSVYDFTVEDTQTFIFKNGIISHNCDDFAVFMKCCSLVFGVPDFRHKLVARNVFDKSGKNLGGHLNGIYLSYEQNIWYTIESTYYLQDAISNFGSVPDGEYVLYKGDKPIWFTFRQAKAYAQKDYYVEKRFWI